MWRVAALALLFCLGGFCIGCASDGQNPGFATQPTNAFFGTSSDLPSRPAR